MKENIYEVIYDVVRLIPKGRVSTYGAIAQAIGMKSGARMVGYAMNSSHFQGDVPAHRVVNSQGLLTGKFHFGEPDRMQKLLEQEGVKVVNDKVQHFDKLFWNPLNEMKIDD